MLFLSAIHTGKEITSPPLGGVKWSNTLFVLPLCLGLSRVDALVLELAGPSKHLA